MARRWTRRLEIAEVINNNGPLAVQAILKTIRETEGMHELDAFKPDTANGIRSSSAMTPRKARRHSPRSGRPTSRWK